jgi:7-cyano-7-deazaguanine synthase in queuosine biosynthesis
MQRVVLFSGGVGSSLLLYDLIEKHGFNNITPILVHSGDTPNEATRSIALDLCNNLGVSLTMTQSRGKQYRDYSLAFWGLEMLSSAVYSITQGGHLKGGDIGVYLGVTLDNLGDLDMVDDMCRFCSVLSQAISGQVRLITPFKYLSRDQVIEHLRLTYDSDLDYFITETQSCELGTRCGHCDGCYRRFVIFQSTNTPKNNCRVDPESDGFRGFVSKILEGNYSTQYCKIVGEWLTL